MLVPTYSQLALFLTAALSMGGAVDALGINCRGSGNCGTSADAASKLVNILQTLNPNKNFLNRQQIACSGSICAFLQNTGGASGSKIKELAHYITGHNCKVCGSVPYYYPQGNNNVADGQLTFNWVDNPCPGSGQTRLC
ncbi:killer toxin [Cladorrhinum sp. PSN332]|nr:killer toxin [Cladorrhinum sp. PSN332]